MIWAPAVLFGRLGVGGDLSDQGFVDGETKRRHFCGELLLYCVRDVVLETSGNWGTKLGNFHWKLGNLWTGCKLGWKTILTEMSHPVVTVMLGTLLSGQGHPGPSFRRTRPRSFAGWRNLGATKNQEKEPRAVAYLHPVVALSAASNPYKIWKKRICHPRNGSPILVAQRSKFYDFDLSPYPICCSTTFVYH